jgi:hypothetical protein
MDENKVTQTNNQLVVPAVKEGDVVTNQQELQQVLNKLTEKVEELKNEQSENENKTKTPNEPVAQNKAVYSPNKSYLFSMIDKFISFIKAGKELEKQLGHDIPTMSKEQLETEIAKENDGDRKALLEKYKKLREEFDFVEQQILTEASVMFGFNERDYFIKPLKDMMDEIKTNRININKITEYLTRLGKLIVINQMIEKIPAVPVAGPIVYAVMNSLDNFQSSQAAINKIVSMLKDLGVTSCTLDFILTYTQNNFFMRKYEWFKGWLVGDETFDFSMYPFSIFKEFRDALNRDNLYFIFTPPKATTESNDPEYQEEKEDVLNNLKQVQTENQEQIKEGDTKGGSIYSKSERVEDWFPIGNVKPRNNKKTRRSIYKINQTIKSHLSRLRRTRRKPFRKSVASLHVKRRF